VNSIIGHTKLRRQLAENRAHSVILEGPAQVGRRVLAHWYAQLLNCRQPLNDEPCGTCPSCQNFAAQKTGTGTHPDVLEVCPREETSTGKRARVSIIGIGAISAAHDTQRDHEIHVLDWLETAARYRHKVVIVDGASFLNESAANALLKSVEEPPHGARFVFITEEVSGVIPTIVSRSVRYRVAPVSDLEIERALPGADQRLLEFAAGRVGLMLQAERVRAQFEVTGGFLDAAKRDLLGAFSAADTLEKAFERDLTPHALRFLLRDLEMHVRVRVDAAITRAGEALERYATPNLVFAHLMLEVRDALGVRAA
jgi:DNA polymerase-3 subunit delta'